MKEAENGRTTIFEVAEAAGVSITTVSHVFSGKRRVHEETKQRVIAAATRLAYNPSSAAKALATGRSYALALQVSFSGEALVLNSFFSALLPAVSLAAVGSRQGTASSALSSARDASTVPCSSTRASTIRS